MTRWFCLLEHRIVVILAEDNLITIETKYHQNCYIGFRCWHDAMTQSREQGKASDNIKVVIENELLQ